MTVEQLARAASQQYEYRPTGNSRAGCPGPAVEASSGEAKRVS